jgi:hypothetical protein
MAVATMPTLAIANRARFIIYLPLKNSMRKSRSRKRPGPSLELGGPGLAMTPTAPERHMTNLTNAHLAAWFGAAEVKESPGEAGALGSIEERPESIPKRETRYHPKA